MRSLLTLALLAVLANVAFADEIKRRPGEDEIKVVALTRKDPVVYEKDIEPILLNKCSVCHSGNVKEGRFDVSSYEEMIKGGKHGKSVEAGKSEQSLLYKLARKMQKPFMPPRSEEPLTPQELATIKLWIDQGAKPPTGMREKTKVIVQQPSADVHPVRGVAISPDKTLVIAARGNQIHVYDAKEGKYLRSLIDPKLVGVDGKPIKAAHISLVESLAYSPDGKTIASGSFQEVTLWDAASGAVKQKLTGFSERVVALAYSKDGKYLATGGGAPTEDGEIKLFEGATGKLVVDIKNGHSDTVFGVCFSPDGTKLATCGADKFVKTFEVPSGKFIKAFEGHTHHVLGVGWKNDGKMLASGGADNVVKIWDFEKGEQVRTINNAHTKQVTMLVFVGTTTQFATCSGDKQVRFWNVDNGGNTRNLQGNNDFLYALAVSSDGTLAAVGGEEGVVRLYNATNGQVLKTLQPPEVK